MASLADRAKEIDWYHTLELAPGVVTPGMFDLRGDVGKYGLPDRLDGQRVLDVGTWDGFWAFELERRGAAEVVALDVDYARDFDLPPRRRASMLSEEQRGQGFRLAKEAFDSKVERVGCSIYHAIPEDLGTFDFVFCGSVLIHLRDQLLALERIAGLTSGTFLSVEAYDPVLNVIPFPVALFRWPRDRAVVFWEPSARTWTQMLEFAGFDHVARKSRFRLKAREGWTVHHVVHEARKEPQVDRR